MKWLNRELQRFVITCLVIAMLAGANIVLSFVHIPEPNRDIINQIIGGIIVLATVAVKGYFDRPTQDAQP